MRYFLIDKVLELGVGERARGVKSITLTDEILHDHFPDYPVMPGCLILESMAQLAGFLLEMTFARPGAEPQRALLAGVKEAKFHDIAGPGDQLEIEVAIASRLEAAAQVEAVARVGERRVARATLTFVLRDVPSARLHEHRREVYRLWTRDLDPPVTIP